MAAGARDDSASLSAMLGILDGSVLPADEVQIPATDEGLLRGDGVFEVMRLYDGRPFALDDHLERMARSAANLGCRSTSGAVRADIDALLEAARPEATACVRVLVTRGGRRIGFLEPLPELPDTLALADVTYVADARSSTASSRCPTAANMLATRLARRGGADEALLVTPHGRVLEAPTSSFFCSLDGAHARDPAARATTSSTRSPAGGCCSSATIARAADHRATTSPTCRRRSSRRRSREVLPVHAIDGARSPAAPGPLTRDADERVRAQIAQELGAAAR